MNSAAHYCESAGTAAKNFKGLSKKGLPCTQVSWKSK